MITRYLKSLFLAVGAATMAATVAPAADPPPLALDWVTVVNNNDQMPEEPYGRTFNSYNQPSVNAAGLVVIRARSRGGPPLGPATHGIYTRDMNVTGSLVRILDRSSLVPYPNNVSTKFVETPSFPRIDIWSDNIATRGNHQPVWTYNLPDTTETRAGTTGIYANPFGDLITGAAKLGGVSDFGFFAVPNVVPATTFDVFPGAPSVTGSTIVFKGNYTVMEGGKPVGKTGVFFRNLTPETAGGVSPIRMIANTDTLIPGMGKRSKVLFGSTSPPSAANREAVFAGFDNEENPTAGGIYLAPLVEQPYLTPLVGIGSKVPDLYGRPGHDVFNRLGEGVSFDGQYVAFWGAWGAKTRMVTVQCPKEGNKNRQVFCLKNSPNNDGFYVLPVPAKQGIFVNDTFRGETWMVARTGNDFEDFLFWNFSGMVPGVGEGGEGDDDGEPAQWRSSSFAAVSGSNATGFQVAFKAAKADGTIGIYLATGPEPLPTGVMAVIDTNTDGSVLDLKADGLKVTEVGIERDGFRKDWLVINAKMGIDGGTEEDGMAGIYVTRVPKAPPR